MPQVTCPQCGAVNGTNTPDYPFCLGCQDNLKKCGYCRWFDPEPAVCTNHEVAGVFDVSGDATPPCDRHTPVDALLVANRSLWAVLLMCLVAVLVLAYAVYQFTQPIGRSLDARHALLQLHVAGGGQRAVVGHPFRTQVEIRNAGSETVGGIRFQISKESVPVFFRLASILPKEAAWEEAGQWTSYTYPDVAPHEQITIVLELVPRQPGDHPVSVRLLSRGSTFQGARQLPVRVAEAPDQKEAGGPTQ